MTVRPSSSVSRAAAQVRSGASVRVGAGVRKLTSPFMRSSVDLGRQRQLSWIEIRGHPEPDERGVVIAPRERLRSALRDDPARGDHRDAVGEVLRLVHVVRGEQDRLAERPEALNELPGAPPCRRVEPGGGLVEEDELRVAGDPERQVEPPSLAAGERPDPGVALLLEPHQLDDLVRRERARDTPR